MGRAGSPESHRRLGAEEVDWPKSGELTELRQCRRLESVEGFEWDEAKANANLRKHGIDFLDAALVFDDEARLDWFDDREHYQEDRFCTLGDVQGRIIFVAYTIRGDRIRLITARRASTKEREEYYGNRET